MGDQIYVAKHSAIVKYEGRQVNLRAGVTRVREGHQLLKDYETLFEPLEVHYEVEKATKAPGEKRTRRRRAPAKTQATKPEPEEEIVPEVREVTSTFKPPSDES